GSVRPLGRPIWPVRRGTSAWFPLSFDCQPSLLGSSPSRCGTHHPLRGGHSAARAGTETASGFPCCPSVSYDRGGRPLSAGLQVSAPTMPERGWSVPPSGLPGRVGAIPPSHPSFRWALVTTLSPRLHVRSPVRSSPAWSGSDGYPPLGLYRVGFT